MPLPVPPRDGAACGGISGKVREDELREGLYNLLLARNEPAIHNFEAHLLIANLGNLDWRPLLNLWSVLEYLTKYSAKAGKPTKQLTTLFDDVLSDIMTHETENGETDLWRRTIMKFYNRILGNRDYTLFEVVHHGLRLAPCYFEFR